MGARIITDPEDWLSRSGDSLAGTPSTTGSNSTPRPVAHGPCPWQPPGFTEGLAVYDSPLVPDVFEAGVAVWDVSAEPPWAACLGERIVAVEPDYEPWDASGAWWCRRLHLRFPNLRVNLFEAEGR